MSDLDIERLREQLSQRVIGCQVRYYESLGSTMDEASRLAQDGAPEGTVIVAEQQTAGRGRFSRSWIGPAGENLTFSVMIRPSLAQLRYMNMAATLAVSRTVSELTGREATLKWPNDVRIDRRKVSGILVESAVEGGEVSYAVVGIGLNANFDPLLYPEIAGTATSVAAVLGRPVDRTELLLAVLESFDDLYGSVRAGESLTALWASRMDMLGALVEVRSENEVILGRARGVDEEGNLLIAKTDGSTVSVVAGDVTLSR